MTLQELKELAEKAEQGPWIHPDLVLDLITRVEKLSEALKLYAGESNYYPEDAREALAQYGADKELG